jgi:hypothetical protein
LQARSCFDTNGLEAAVAWIYGDDWMFKVRTLLASTVMSVALFSGAAAPSEEPIAKDEVFNKVVEAFEKIVDTSTNAQKDSAKAFLDVAKDLRKKKDNKEAQENLKKAAEALGVEKKLEELIKEEETKEEKK